MLASVQKNIHQALFRRSKGALHRLSWPSNSKIKALLSDLRNYAVDSIMAAVTVPGYFNSPSHYTAWFLGCGQRHMWKCTWQCLRMVQMPQIIIPLGKTGKSPPTMLLCMSLVYPYLSLSRFISLP
jgi:hypothetical protein